MARGVASADGSTAGDAGQQTQAVPIPAIVGNVDLCPTGSAHPNVCCESGPDQATSCTETPGNPFVPCSSKALTFPDPRTCCALDDASQCSPGDGGAAPATGCSYLCPPGGFPPSELADPIGLPACTDVDNSLACVYCCAGVGCPTNQCSCPEFIGGDGGGCHCGPSCGPCPSGWQTPQGIPDLCCRTNPDGSAQCFSEASEVQSPQTGLDCGSGSATTCGCTDRTIDGPIYELSCDSTKSPPCVCKTDGVTTATIGSFGGCPPLPMPPQQGLPIPPPAPQGPMSQELMQLLSECRFPLVLN
jgi:hypothetical protein